MSWTKRQLIEQAFEIIGMASYTYDLQPEQLQSAMRQLDTMMATWNNKGVQLGYPIPSTPENADLDDETNVPDRANEAIYMNLAIRIAPNYGKQVMRELKQAAFYAYQGLLSVATFPQEMQYPETLPTGAGNKPHRWDDEFFPTPYGPYQPWDND
jgi:hypothetical protein